MNPEHQEPRRAEAAEEESGAKGAIVEEPLEAAAPPAEVDPVAALAGERDQLAAENADLKDRFLRQRAEFENFRRRTERERSDFLQYAGAEALAAILPVLDDFERARKVPCADAEYQKGVELIYQRLLDALTKMGLEPIEARGLPFDPNLHQAVQREETADAEDQTILDEYQTGYNFKGKLLRPSMVKVAVKPS